MRRTLLLLVMLGVSCSLHANICAYDQAPAASLLFPFVTFDYETPYGGETTLIAITNLSHEAQVVQVGFWTDLGIPFLEFNMVLAGYDVQRFNVRDILYHGTLPVTVSQDHPGGGGLVFDGPVTPYNDANRASWIDGVLPESEATSRLEARCTPEHQSYPGLYEKPIPKGVLDLFQAWLDASRFNSFASSEDVERPFDDPSQPPSADWIASRGQVPGSWMYVTADVVESCDISRPIESSAWVPAAEGGEARYDNVLTGEAYWISGSTSTAMAAVHIEADQQLAQVASENAVTGQPVSFYARYSNSLTEYSDYREPLPTAWAIRYVGAANPNMSTRILAWKGSTNFTNPYDLEIIDEGTLDLDPESIVASDGLAYTVYAWDEDSNVHSEVVSCGGGVRIPEDPVLCANQLPLATQEVPVSAFKTVADSGWMLFVWPDSNYGGLEGAPEAPDHYQTWMGVRQTAWGTHEDFMPGTPVANANCFADQVLPGLGVDYDYVTE